MTRIRFEDLPSRNTPRNAENLNKLNNVVISPTEPTTGEEVWIKKGKNLLNKNDLTENYYLSYTDGTPTWDSSFCYMNEYILVNPDTLYTMSANTGTMFIIHEYDEDKNFIRYTNQNTSETSLSITTTSTTKYVRLSFGKSMKDVMQFQQGPATDYEEYIDKEIYVKNDNGVYELFDKVERTSIITGALTPTNEYIDGKRVYVKRVNFGALPNATYKQVDTGISKSLYNFEYFIGKAKSGTYIVSLPSISLHGLEYCTTCGIDGSAANYAIEISTGVDRSGWTAIVDVYVTKK